jgi:hypothetical protein
MDSCEPHNAEQLLHALRQPRAWMEPNTASLQGGGVILDLDSLGQHLGWEVGPALSTSYRHMD